MCNRPGKELGLGPLSAISFCGGLRIGEAQCPGPYFEGGSSGSGSATTSELVHLQGGASAAEASHQGLATQRGVHHTRSWASSMDSSPRQPPAGAHTFAAWCRGGVPVLLDGPHGNRVQVAQRHEVRQLVSDHLNGQLWDEVALDRILQELDSNTGPPTLDVLSLIIPELSSQAALPRLAPVTPPSDILVQFFQRAEKRYAETYATPTVITKASLNQVMVCDSPQLHELPVGPEADQAPQLEALPQLVVVSEPVQTPPLYRPRRRKKIPHLQWNQLHEVPQASDGAAAVRRRPRTKRGGTAQVHVLLINSSGGPQFQAAMVHPSKEVVAIINQEHQSQGIRWVDLCADAKKMGWRLAGSQAKETPKKGTSAGVAIVVRAHLETGLCAQTADLSPTGSEGRLAAAWSRFGPGTSILILSAYLWHSEGLTLRNKKILVTAISKAKYFGCPWIMGADFHMPPEELMQAFGTILDEADAFIVAPSEPTHRPELGTHRIIDYFIVSSTIQEHIADVAVDLAYSVSPHRAVRSTLRTPRHNPLKEEMHMPRAFPRQRPIGCPRAPVIKEWSTDQSFDGLAATRRCPGYCANQYRCGQKLAILVQGNRMRIES